MALSSAIAPTREIALPQPKLCKLEIGDTYAGGIIFHLDSGKVCHGLVCAPSNQPGNVDWMGAVTLCNSLNIGGYSDWRLPNSSELNEMYTNLYVTGLADFPTNYYWSCSGDNNGFAYAQYFSGGSRNVHRYIYKKVTHFMYER